MAMLTGGTLFLIWLSEQITLRGIRNGLALILFTSVITQVPSGIVNLLELGRQGVLSSGFILVVLAMAVAVVGFIVLMEMARRRVPLEFAGGQVGTSRLKGDLSLKINCAGIIPAFTDLD
jgi:preprotein translocase subunit SecY